LVYVFFGGKAKNNCPGFFKDAIINIPKKVG